MRNIENPLTEEMQEAELNKLLENLPPESPEEVELPSRGLTYKSCPSGRITVRPMTFEDEKYLALNAKKQGIHPTLNGVIARCVKGININELLSQDKMFLLLKIRELSYGADYNATITCANCDQEVELSFNLTKLPIKFAEDDLKAVMEVNLPKLGKIAKVRLPTVSDEHYLLKEDEETSVIWRNIEEIGGCVNKTLISKVIDKLPLVDIHAIKKVMNLDFGVQTEVKFTCDKCEHVNIIQLPLTGNFFSVS